MTEDAKLSEQQLKTTTDWLLSRQRPSGEIPWCAEGKMDPWDHVHSAMGLTVRGHVEEALSAYQFSADTQDPNGGWASERKGGKVTRSTCATRRWRCRPRGCSPG